MSDPAGGVEEFGMFWLWIAIAVVVGLIVGGVAIWLLLSWIMQPWFEISAGVFSVINDRINR